MIGSKEWFPTKLYLMLETEDLDIVRWVRSGFAFKVFDSRRFENIILPKYYRHSKLESFQRQLNLYGFKRVNQGEDMGAYYHPLLVQGRRDWAERITKEPISEELYKEIMEYAEMHDPDEMMDTNESRVEAAGYEEEEHVTLPASDALSSTHSRSLHSLHVPIDQSRSPTTKERKDECGSPISQLPSTSSNQVNDSSNLTVPVLSFRTDASDNTNEDGNPPNKTSESDVEDLLADTELLDLLL